MEGFYLGKRLEGNSSLGDYLSKNAGIHHLIASIKGKSAAMLSIAADLIFRRMSHLLRHAVSLLGLVRSNGTGDDCGVFACCEQTTLDRLELNGQVKVSTANPIGRRADLCDFVVLRIVGGVGRIYNRPSAWTSGIANSECQFRIMLLGRILIVDER